MIEVGKTYSLLMIETTNECYHTVSTQVTVTAVNGFLVQLDGHWIINTASPMFHSLTDEEGRKAYVENLQLGI